MVLFLSPQSDRKKYNGVSFYVCAHQDDWQLFMGADAFNDINSFDEKKEAPNGKKVVIIYTTAGNLNDDDDTKSCDCRDMKNARHRRLPYWQVREEGAKNSVHLAACRMGGWGVGNVFADYKTDRINGHKVRKYVYKNTVSYFLRVKSGRYGKWFDSSNVAAGTVDKSTTYESREDFVRTLLAIYSAELDGDAATDSVFFHWADTDEHNNPNDHHDHLVAARVATEAAEQLASKKGRSFPAALYVDYHTQNLPVNIAGDDGQNEAAMTGAYCQALLDYNAWPEWGQLYREWTNRNYYRVVEIGKKR